MRFIDPYTFPLGEKTEDPEPDQRIIVIQDEPTVTCVWDAAIVFSRYVLRHHEVLYPNSPNLTQPPRVIELGAGTGLAGLTCAWLGAQVTLTELGDCLPVLQRNVESFITQHPSCASRVEACEYYWGSTLGGTGSADDTEAFSSPTPSVTPALLQQRLASGGYDLVIGTDVIYEVQHFDALLRALLDLTQRRWNPRGAKVVLAYQHRWADVERYFFEDISRHFKVEHVPSEAQDPAFSSPFIHIVSLTRRRVSLGEFDRH